MARLGYIRVTFARGTYLPIDSAEYWYKAKLSRFQKEYLEYNIQYTSKIGIYPHDNYYSRLEIDYV